MGKIVSGIRGAAAAAARITHRVCSAAVLAAALLGVMSARADEYDWVDYYDPISKSTKWAYCRIVQSWQNTNYGQTGETGKLLANGRFCWSRAAKRTNPIAGRHFMAYM